MIKVIPGSVFASNADCIINTVNCVGVMGKGLALEFALRYPKLEEIYKEQCKNHEIKTGNLYFYEVDGQKIINFPTKFHFAKPSQIEWIEQGLDCFATNYKKWNIKSIAFPLLGARNGGLDSNFIIDLITKKLAKLDIQIFICLNKEPDQKEIEMVNNFKSCDIVQLAEQLNLNAKKLNELKAMQHSMNKFEDLLSNKVVDSKKYKIVYNYFYTNQLPAFRPLV